MHRYAAHLAPRRRRVASPPAATAAGCHHRSFTSRRAKVPTASCAAPPSTGGAAADRLPALGRSRAPLPSGVARVPAGTGDAGAGGEPDALGVRAPPLCLFSIADHVVRTGGASLLRCGARRSRLVGPSGTATRPPQQEGPAQAAHAAEGDEEVAARNEFMCARHACGAAGRRPPCSARSAQLPKPCTEYPDPIMQRAFGSEWKLSSQKWDILIRFGIFLSLQRL